MKFGSFLARIAAVAGLCGLGLLSTGNLAAQDRSTVNELDVRSAHEPPLMGIHWAREFAHTARTRRSPDMTWHNGAIMTSSAVTAIYWGTSWTSANPKVAGLQSFYQGFSNSNYAKTSDEYTGTNGQVGSSNSYGGFFIDTTPATGGNQVSPILAEVCKVIPSPVSNGYYPVYTDIKRGSAGYCAWHSYGSCGGTPVQIAFFFNLDGDPGCDPQDTQTGHHKVSLLLLTSARTSSRKHAPILATADGMTRPALKMVISAPGRSMFHTSHSPMAQCGRFRASGQTTPTTRERAIRTAQAREVVWTDTEFS